MAQAQALPFENTPEEQAEIERCKREGICHICKQEKCKCGEGEDVEDVKPRRKKRKKILTTPYTTAPSNPPLDNFKLAMWYINKVGDPKMARVAFNAAFKYVKDAAAAVNEKE